MGARLALPLALIAGAAGVGLLAGAGALGLAGLLAGAAALAGAALLLGLPEGLAPFRNWLPVASSLQVV